VAGVLVARRSVQRPRSLCGGATGRPPGATNGPKNSTTGIPTLGAAPSFVEAARPAVGIPQLSRRLAIEPAGRRRHTPAGPEFLRSGMKRAAGRLLRRRLAAAGDCTARRSKRTGGRHPACSVLRSPARATSFMGVWLRREEPCRPDSRDHLRTAHENWAAIGMEAFAELALRELQGPRARGAQADVDNARNDLEPAQGSADRPARPMGLSNPENTARGSPQPAGTVDVAILPQPVFPPKTWHPIQGRELCELPLNRPGPRYSWP